MARCDAASEDYVELRSGFSGRSRNRFVEADPGAARVIRHHFPFRHGRRTSALCIRIGTRLRAGRGRTHGRPTRFDIVVRSDMRVGPDVLANTPETGRAGTKIGAERTGIVEGQIPIRHARTTSKTRFPCGRARTGARATLRPRSCVLPPRGPVRRGAAHRGWRAPCHRARPPPRPCAPGSAPWPPRSRRARAARTRRWPATPADRWRCPSPPGSTGTARREARQGRRARARPQLPAPRICRSRTRPRGGGPHARTRRRAPAGNPRRSSVLVPETMVVSGPASGAIVEYRLVLQK